MNLSSRRDLVYLLLAGFFITNALVAELIGVKLFQVGPFAMSVGVIPWPVVFLSTDLINEYFGVRGVRRLTFLTMGLIAYAFLVIFVAIQIPAALFSPVQDETFEGVFGQSLWIIGGSLAAFAASQLVDVLVFWFFRRQTGGRHLWLRATGSTVVSQLFDSVIVVGVAFWLPGKVQTTDFLNVALSNYSYKLIIALCLTPLIYVFHSAIDKFLGEKESQALISQAVKNSEKSLS